jgi:4-amino-4-deoxy-L-arabinose transferase-like glycosyltransferase
MTTDELIYAVLRWESAFAALCAAVLIVAKNWGRWKRTSPRPLPYGARLWRFNLVVLMVAFCAAYVTSAIRGAPGQPASVYLPCFLTAFAWGLWADFRWKRDPHGTACPECGQRLPDPHGDD